MSFFARSDELNENDEHLPFVDISHLVKDEDEVALAANETDEETEDAESGESSEEQIDSISDISDCSETSTADSTDSWIFSSNLYTNDISVISAESNGIVEQNSLSPPVMDEPVMDHLEQDIDLGVLFSSFIHTPSTIVPILYDSENEGT